MQNILIISNTVRRKRCVLQLNLSFGNLITFLEFAYYTEGSAVCFILLKRLVNLLSSPFLEY